MPPRDVLFKYVQTGYTERELLDVLSTYGDPSGMSSREAEFYLSEYFARMGGAPPEGQWQNLPGQEGTPRYNWAQWLRLGGGRQAQGLTEQLLPKEVRAHPTPADWYPGTVSRGGSTVWSAGVYEQNWLGIPGEEPGTMYVSRSQESVENQVKTAKYTQQNRPSYEYPELYDIHGNPMMQEAPFKLSPESPRYERGVRIPMAFLMSNVLPEGMEGLPRNRIGYGGSRRSKEFWSPTPLEFVEKGTYWQTGEAVQPFQSSAPVRFGLGESADWVEYLGHMQERQTRRVGGEDVEGYLYRAQFEVGASVATLRPELKTGITKGIGVERARDIPGLEGYGIAYLKHIEPMSQVYWAGHPERAAQELGVGLGELRQKTWRDIGLPLTNVFRDKVMQEIYHEQQLELGVFHESQLRTLAKGEFEETPIEGQPGYFNVRTRNPVGMIMMDAFMQIRQGYGVTQHNIPFRELQELQQGNPELYQSIMRESAPETRARFGAIGAALATSGQGYGLPLGTITPTSTAVQEVVMRAEQRALQATGAADVASLPSWTLERMVIQEAAGAWGESPLALDSRTVAMAPEHIRRFSVEGITEDTEVSRLGRSFARTLIDFGSPEAYRESLGRFREAQEEFAGGREFKQKALRAYTRRVIGERAQIDPSLQSSQISAPVEEVMRAYGVPEKYRGQFESGWLSGEIDPRAHLYRHPTTGEEFGYTVSLVHPSLLQGDFEQGRSLAVSPTGMEVVGGDADGDDVYATVSGQLLVNKNGQLRLIHPSQVKQITNPEMAAKAEQMAALGRPELTRGTENMTFGQLQESLRLENLHKIGTGDIEAAMQERQRRGTIIGPYYAAMEDIKDVASELGLSSAGKQFMLSVHGVTQAYGELPEDLGATAQLMSSMTPKGGIRNPLASEKQWGFLKARGLQGAQRRLFEYLAGGESLEPGLVAQMMFPRGVQEEATSLIGKFRGATGGEAVELAGRAAGLLGTVEQMTETPLGGTLAARFAGTGLSAKELGLSEPAYQRALARRERHQARRAMLTKSPGRAGMEGLVQFEQALSTMHPEARRMLPEREDVALSEQIDTLLNALTTPEEQVSGAEIPATQAAAGGGGAEVPPIPTPIAPAEAGGGGPTGGGGGTPIGGGMVSLPGGGVAKMLPPTSLRKAQSAMSFMTTQLPRWMRDVYPRIAAGQTLTSGEGSFTRALQREAGTLESYQMHYGMRQQGGEPLSPAQQNMLMQIGTFQGAKGFGGQLGLLETMGGPAAQQQQVEGWLTSNTKALEKSTEAVLSLRETVKEHGQVMQEQVAAYTGGKFQPGREWFRGVSAMGRMAGEAIGAAQVAGVPEPAWATSVAGAAGAAEQYQLNQMLGGAFGGGGGARGRGRNFYQQFQKLAVGWAPFQMRRAWSMLGAPVFNQMIPAAAGAELAGWGLTQGIGGFDQGMPEGVAGGVLQYQAAQRQSLIEGGRAGYRAWGWTMQNIPGLRAAQGIAGPAAGAGLAAAIGLNAIGSGAAAGSASAALGAAAGPIGLAVAGVGLGMGGTEYLRSYGQETAENQLLASQGIWGRVRSTVGRAAEEGGLRGWQFLPGAQSALPGAIGGFLGALPQAWQWSGEQAQAGAAIQQAPMGQQTAQQRMASLNYVAAQLNQQTGTRWSGMDEGQILQQMQRFAAYDQRLQTMTPEQMVSGTPREWAYETSPQQYEQLAGQLALGAGGAMDLLQRWGGQNLYEQRRMSMMAGQWSSLTNMGVSGQAIVGALPQLGELGAQGQYDLGRMMSRDQTWWSRAGRQGASIGGLNISPEQWMITQEESGLPIGTTTGGDILQRHLGTTGAPGKAIDVSGGQVTFNVQGQQVQVDFSEWGMQDFATQQSRQQQQWQFGFQQQGLNLESSYMLGTGQFTGAGVFPMRYEQLDLRDQQFKERQALAQQKIGVQFGWQGQDIETQYGRQMRQFQWQEEDLAFRGAQMSMQFGWQQEDYQEAIRYSTGRQRRRLMEQQERSTIMYGMNMGQLGTQRARLDERREWADEDADKARERHQQRLEWAQAEMDLSRRHHDQDMSLARRRLDAEKQYWELQQERQQESLNRSREYWELTVQIQDAQTAFARARANQLAQFQMQWLEFFDRMEEKLAALDSSSGSGSTSYGYSPYSGPPITTGGGGNGFSPIGAE